MALTAGSPVHVFGTPVKVTVASPGAVANGALSASSDVNTWTNSDNAPLAMFILVLKDLSGAATAGDTVPLYCRLLNVVNTTGDTQGPTATLKTRRLDAFLVDAVDPAGTGDNYPAGWVELPNMKDSQEYDFYIYNGLTTVGIDAADWELWIYPGSLGPYTP